MTLKEAIRMMETIQRALAFGEQQGGGAAEVALFELGASDAAEIRLWLESCLTKQEDCRRPAERQIDIGRLN